MKTKNEIEALVRDALQKRIKQQSIPNRLKKITKKATPEEQKIIYQYQYIDENNLKKLKNEIEQKLDKSSENYYELKNIIEDIKNIYTDFYEDCKKTKEQLRKEGKEEPWELLHKVDTLHIKWGD